MVYQELLKLFKSDTSKTRINKYYKKQKTNNKSKQLQKGGNINELLSSKEGVDIVVYKMYNNDDTTITKDQDRCMCINYKMVGNTFSLKSNPDAHRCTKKVKPGTDFCELHQNCKNFLRSFLSGYEPEYDTELVADPS